ncbi:MAG: hypothetical protein PQJ46_12295, partial [Spirochaetales bacterium]|nr:hypothetical protein [Spirochaetales bacterium]
FEIFFYYIFIFAIFFNIFKINPVFVLTRNFWDLYPMLQTRLIYYGKLVGTLSLLSAGLFATGLEYQRIGLATVLVFLIPAALVMVLPIDTSVIVIGNTFKIGSFIELISIIMIINVISIINFIIAGIKNDNKDYYIIAITLLLAITGREIAFYFTNTFLEAAGFLLLLVGTSIFSWKVHHLYLWY